MNKTDVEYWVIPCSIKRFNLLEHFQKHSNVVWKNLFSIHKGDIVYIYLGAPFSEIKYQCVVASEEVDEETLKANSYAISTKPSKNYYSKQLKYIILELDKEFPSGTFKLEDLRKNGMGQTQIQARANRQLKAYILSKEESKME